MRKQSFSTVPLTGSPNVVHPRDSLLSTPAHRDSQNPKSILRETATYNSYDDDFRVKERTYTQQYAGLYFSRLNIMRRRVLKAANERWGSGPSRSFAENLPLHILIAAAEPTPHVPKVLDVKSGVVCFVVGTVYVDMPLKPNILDEVTADVRCETLRGLIGLCCS